MSDRTFAEAFDEAMARFRAAEVACDAAAAEKKAAKRALEDVIGSLASSSDDPEFVDAMSAFYWHDEPTGRLLAHVLRSVHRVSFWPKPINVLVPCRDCGTDCVVRCLSWTSRGGLSARCDDCESRHQREVFEFREAMRQANGHLTDDELAAARAMPYRDYLMTDHWQVVRVDAVKRARGKCQVCHSSRPLDVHHRTYERLGCERPEDVIALCRSCHGIFHKNGKLVTAP